MVESTGHHSTGDTPLSRQQQLEAEQALGILIGVAPDVAAAAAARVIDDWPDLGLLTVAALTAARWGIDLVPAVDRLAAGDPVHGAISDYEQRTAAEEAVDEAGRCLDRIAAQLSGDRDRPDVVDLSPNHPLTDAARATVAGRALLRLSEPPGVQGPPRPLRRWVVGLADRVGAQVVAEGAHDSSDPSRAAYAPHSAYVGFDQLIC